MIKKKKSHCLKNERKHVEKKKENELNLKHNTDTVKGMAHLVICHLPLSSAIFFFSYKSLQFGEVSFW